MPITTTNNFSPRLYSYSLFYNSIETIIVNIIIILLLRGSCYLKIFDIIIIMSILVYILFIFLHTYINYYITILRQNTIIYYYFNKMLANAKYIFVLMYLGLIMMSNDFIHEKRKKII